MASCGDLWPPKRLWQCISDAAARGTLGPGAHWIPGDAVEVVISILSNISGLSDSDGPENNYDLVDAGGPGLRASGPGPFAGLSIFRRQAAPHFASRPPSARMSI